MTLRKFIAPAATAAVLLGAAFGASTPASAQDWHHHGYYHRYGWGHPGYYTHGGGYGYGGGYGWHHSAYAWNPGPGYSWHSWAWYNSRPGYWRAEHPYYHHGNPSVGVWLRL